MSFYYRKHQHIYSFDHFIDEMLADKDFCSVIFDLSHVEAVDSTTLGLMAKISILSKVYTPTSSVGEWVAQLTAASS